MRIKVQILTVISLLLSLSVNADIVLQAETGKYTGKTDIQHTGYTGTGFVDMTNAVGSTLLFDFSLAEEMHDAVVLVRWANGKSDDRAMSFTVNDSLQIARQEFGFSGAFTTWLETSCSLSFRKGRNTLLITALTSNGGPNLDKITIVGGEEGVKEYSLSIVINGKGGVTRNPDKTFYPQNETVHLEAIPDSASLSSFTGWTGDFISDKKSIDIKITRDLSLSANFRSSLHSVYYCAPLEKGGSDTNDGSINSPFYNLSKAVSLMQGGDTVFLRGGTYNYTSTIKLTNSGTSLEPICIFNYPGEHPVLDFYDIFSSYTNVNSTLRGTARGFLITGNYYYLKGLEICQAPDNGIKVEGSHNVFERLVLHHNGDSGIQIGLAKDSPDAADKVCWNLVKNCDSYRNLDWGTSYENADGFSCKLSPGANNKFIGCRAWENSDDGWDFYMTHYTIYIDSCWTMGNGNPALASKDDADWKYGQRNELSSSWSGDGNGFKLGGDDWAAKHQVNNCIAFDGYSTGAGFSENNNADSLYLYNCVSWQNIKNFRLSAYPCDVRNCISFDAKKTGSSAMFDLQDGTIEKNNSWNTINGSAALVPVSSGFDQKSVYKQFVSTSKADFMAPREADGSLPENGFGRLVAGSYFIDKGTNTVKGVNPSTLKPVEISLNAFSGKAVDLGAYEYNGASAINKISNPAENFLSICPNPVVSNTCIVLNAAQTAPSRLIINDISGKVVYDSGIFLMSVGEKRIFYPDHRLFERGVYLVNFNNGETGYNCKLIKL